MDSIDKCTAYEWEQVSAYNSNTTFRGNVTKVTSYANASPSTPTGAVSYDFTYDTVGNQRTATTNCCQQISAVYSGATYFSLPDSITRGAASTSSSDRITQTFYYDANKEVPTAITDYNGNSTYFSYDAVSRPTVTTFHTGAKRTVSYNDSTLSQNELVQKSTGEGSGTVSNSTVYFNGRGQPIKSVYQADSSSYNAASTQYDAMGRRWKVSMPYDNASSPAYWTEYSYDLLSRMTEQEAADGSTSKMFYNETAVPDSASSSLGQSVRSHDAWGRERWSKTDAFGRMIEVVEPNPNGNALVTTGGTSGTLRTSYIYNASDELTQITQGDQERKFAYDSLGRLKLQKLAEQTATINAQGTYVGSGGSGAAWSEAFVYDTRSNLTQRTDARGVKTNLSYLISGSIDPLNRLQGISYDKTGAVTTPAIADAASVSLEYMTTGDKTRVEKVITSGVVTEENSFDTAGLPNTR